MLRNRAVSLAALSTVPFVMVLGNSMLIPVLPDLKRALHLTSCEASLVITLFSVPAGLVIPLCGYLSDRYGRKKVIIPALLLYGLGGLVAGVAALANLKGSFLWLLGGRVLQGIGAAGTAPIAMALTGDIFQGAERSRALGVIEAANGMGKVASPIIGSALGLISWWAPFFAFPSLNVLSAGAVWQGTRETKRRQTETGLRAHLRALAGVFERRTGLLLTSFLTGMLVLLTLFGLLFYLSELLEGRYHMSGIVKGAVLAIPIFFMASTSYLTGLLVKKRFGVMRVAVISGVVLVAFHWVCYLS
ncbi:MAG: Major facilitator superfamily MFS_1 [Clostridia bacterium 62_21]|nr:MAG: Major facilitator superfamily MFS_1 [Clostridia bacterium 62_21]